MLIVIHLHSGKGKRRDYAVRIVSEWTGKEIKFPKGLSCISMARKRIFLFFSIILFMSSCQQKATESFEMLNHYIVDDDLFIGNGGYMVHLNNNRIVGIDNVAPTCFYLLNIDSSSYAICNFGNKGQGPNDFISPFSLQLIDEVTLGSYDISLRRFFEFSVFQNCSQYDMLKTTIFLDAPSYIIFKTAYNQYIGIGTYENEMFIIFDSEGEKINSFYEFPFKFGANLIGCKHT